MAGYEVKDLAIVRWHWGSAYEVDWDWRERVYTARRRDNGAMLKAGSTQELHQAIRADYIRHPVPRD